MNPFRSGEPAPVADEPDDPLDRDSIAFVSVTLLAISAARVTGAVIHHEAFGAEASFAALVLAASPILAARALLRALARRRDQGTRRR